MTKLLRIVLIGIVFGIGLQQPCAANNPPLVDSTLYFLQRPGDFLEKVISRTSALEAKMVRQSERYIKRLEKQELKLYRKLKRRDSIAAIKIFGDIKGRYADLGSGLSAKAPKSGRFRDLYLGRLDTLRTSLSFLEQKDVVNSDVVLTKSYKKAQEQVNDLQGRFSQVNEIKKALNERTSFLQSQLGKYGMTSQLRKLQKEVYYYQQQLEEYKQILNDPAKLEATALAALNKIPAFQQFFASHSQLGQLFRLPGNSSGGSATAMSSSRAAIEQEIRQRLGNGINVNQLVKEQSVPPSSPFNKLKEQLEQKLSGSLGNENVGIPNFTPNQQRTKSFWKRLEYGTNLQTVKANNYFPVTSDLGLSMGYKLNDKSVVGLGASYKVGWGKDIRHIAISHQGVGVRSFLDVKLKGSFWLTGGGEMNYRTPFSDMRILEDVTKWQQSALFGLQKRYQRGKMKGQVQLLYDFLWRQQVPVAQPLLFRLGYNLK